VLVLALNGLWCAICVNRVSNKYADTNRE